MRLTRRATTEVPPDEKEIRLSIGPLQFSRFNRTPKTIWNATFQNAGFTRHSALRCRTACDPGKNFFPGASRDLFGNRDLETKLEPRVRCANETPESNSDANGYSHSKAYSNADADSDCNPYSHG